MAVSAFSMKQVTLLTDTSVFSPSFLPGVIGGNLWAYPLSPQQRIFISGKDIEHMEVLFPHLM